MTVSELDDHNWTLFQITEYDWEVTSDMGANELEIYKWLSRNVGLQVEIPGTVEVNTVDRAGGDWYIDFVLHEVENENGELRTDYRTYVAFRDPEAAMLFKLTWL